MDTEATKDKRTTFRSSFLIVWGWLALVIVLIGYPLSVATLLLTGAPLAETVGFVLVSLPVVGLFVSVPVTATLYLFFTQSITSSGIDAGSFWGVRRFTAWNDIASIRPFSLAGLKYLRLDSRSDGKTAWLSLFVSRKSKFKQTLLQLAPPDHPIRSYFS